MLFQMFEWVWLSELLTFKIYLWKMFLSNWTGIQGKSYDDKSLVFAENKSYPALPQRGKGKCVLKRKKFLCLVHSSLSSKWGSIMWVFWRQTGCPPTQWRVKRAPSRHLVSSKLSPSHRPDIVNFYIRVAQGGKTVSQRIRFKTLNGLASMSCESVITQQGVGPLRNNKT